MHYPTTDPGPATGTLNTDVQSMNAPLRGGTRGGTVKVWYREEIRENCCGEWVVAVVQFAEWAFGGDVELTAVEKFELEEYIGDRI